MESNVCADECCACTCENSKLLGHRTTDVRAQESSPRGGSELISSAYSQQALCLKQTNIQLSLLSVMVLQQAALQEQ